jgi:16S rRNA (cytidine1402-2'-O)-methyltransferase
MQSIEAGTLYVVGVPIGNLEDITLRAVRVLKGVDLIACEDTRRTGQLLTLLGIPRRPMISVHDHNEAGRVDGLLARLEAGESIALVSDAGTPAISDPGYRVIKAVADAGLPVVPLPGPCAAVVALSAAGLPTDRFLFVGFVPSKSEGRRKALVELAASRETLVFYESPHRLQAFLEAARDALGADRPAVVARELTKRFEEFRRGTLGELVEAPGVNRGEVVVVIGGATAPDEPTEADLESLLRRLLAEGLSPSRAAKAAVEQTGVRKRVAYQQALALAEEDAESPRDGDEAG